MTVPPRPMWTRETRSANERHLPDRAHAADGKWESLPRQAVRVPEPERRVLPVVGILGGTGPQGRGLAMRFAQSGLNVLIGSRSGDRANEVANAMDGEVAGLANEDCAEQCDIAVVAVPFAAHAEFLRPLRRQLAGKVVVDCVNPLDFDENGPFALDVAEGSACEQAQSCLPDSRLTGAFHHLSAVHLAERAPSRVECDVLVTGDDRDAVDETCRLAERIPGVRALFVGGLRNSRQIEAFTASLIVVNQHQKTHAGLRVTHVPSGRRAEPSLIELAIAWDARSRS